MIFLLSILCLCVPVYADSPGSLPDFKSAERGKIGWPDNETLRNEPASALLEKFRTPPPGYGQVPFYWLTGDKLTRERLLWQLNFLTGKTLPGLKPNELPSDYPLPKVSGLQLNTAHAKGSINGQSYGLFGNSYPLDPPFFTPEFWELWQWYVGECDRRQIGIGISDYTLAWPGQGFIVDEVISDPDRQGKKLRCKKERLTANTALSMGETFPNEITRLSRPVPDDSKYVDRYIFYWEHQPKSIDPMDRETGRQIADRFFGESERQVPEEFRSSLNYYFQDELHFAIDGLIWTPQFVDEFQKIKGYDIRPHLAHLFEVIDDTTPKIRLDYYDVKVTLTEKGYFEPVCEWHNQRGMLYGCDQMSRGLTPTEYGDYFRAVRWFSAPGHDTPGSGADIIKGKVSSSISHLYGNPRVWLEGYHSAGWGMTLGNLTRTTNENYAVGCNLLCLHGLYYTTHGGFWEWAPPCYHFRMPYWRHMGVWLQYFERLSFVLSQGHHVADVAIVYPVEDGAAGFDNSHSTNIAFNFGRGLYVRGIDFDFIDGQSIARSRSEKGKMNVANASYRFLVIPSMKALRWNALEKIREFHQAGGVVIALESLPEVSDRVGANDPELQKMMKEIFEDGHGILLSNQVSEPTSLQSRTYEGGSTGPWVWADQPAQDVAFKAVWKHGKARANIRFHADNRGDLFLNGTRICENAGYDKGWTGEINLADGDVIVARCRDDDKAGGKTAGFFFSAVANGKTLLSGEAFLCSTRPEDWNSDAWRRSSSTDQLAGVSQRFVHLFHITGMRDATSLGVINFPAEVEKIISEQSVRDFQVDGGAWVQHRQIETRDGLTDVYFVQHAKKDSWATFRATGDVFLWNAWDGTAQKLMEKETLPDGRTCVLLPGEKEEARLLFFVPKSANLPEIPVYRRYGNAVTVCELNDAWEFETVPTMDNTFGDFRLPVEKNPFDGSFMLGTEARRFKTFRCNQEQSNERFADPSFDDSAWQTVTCGFGTQMFLYALNENQPVAEVESTLLAGKTPEQIGDVVRKPYRFSWRWGVEGNPGEQGYHGLKEHVSDNFLIVPKGVSYFTSTIVLEKESYLYLECSQDVKAPAETTVAPTAVWVDGKPFQENQRFAPGTHRIMAKFDKPGRAHVVFSTEKEANATTRTQLAMKWFDRQFALKYAPTGTEGNVQWFRFLSPPGLAEIVLPKVGLWSVYIDGQKFDITSDAGDKIHFDIPEALKKRSAVVVALKIAGGSYGNNDGGIFGDSVALRCEKGLISPGDWSKMGVLETYSGGAWYRKSLVIDRQELEKVKTENGRYVLDLGRVGASCEVRINGALASVLTSAPWSCDVTSQLVSGENRIEILVMSTLSNHYQTIPSSYRGNPEAGLLGPVRLLKEQNIPSVVPSSGQ